MFYKSLFLSSALLVSSIHYSGEGFASQPTLSEKEQEIQNQLIEMKEEVQNSSGKKEKLENELTNAQLEIVNTQQTIQKIQDSINLLEHDILSVTANINRLEKNIKSLDDEIVVITEKLKNQQHILGQTISFLYETSEVSYIEFFFQSDNLEDLLNTHEFIQLIMDENDLVFQQILITKENLANKQKELTLSKLALNAKVIENETKIKENEIFKSELNSLLTTKQQEELAIFEQIKIENLRESEASKSIVHYIQQLEYLKILLSEDPRNLTLTDVDGNIKPTTMFSNPLPKYTISSDFGMRFHPVLSYTRMHNGVDLGGAHGEPIYSSGNGVVVFAGPAQGFGNWVVIYHGTINEKDIYSIYGHMESNQIAVSNSQRISQGDVIGFVGNAGTSTGPHLHFGIAEGFNGGSFNYVDPKLYINFNPIPTEEEETLTENES